jgi:proteasome lid subunit RPN8/RPN11
MIDSGFEIGAAALAAVIAHARDTQPAECCGVLVGVPGRITESVRARNLAASPTRFIVDPADHIAARRAARAQGLDVIGFYHSHPHTPAWPSPADVVDAYVDAVHLIVSLAGDVPDARLFRIEGGAITELSLRPIA